MERSDMTEGEIPISPLSKKEKLNSLPQSAYADSPLIRGGL